MGSGAQAHRAQMLELAMKGFGWRASRSPGSFQPVFLDSRNAGGQVADTVDRGRSCDEEDQAQKEDEEPRGRSAGQIFQERQAEDQRQGEKDDGPNKCLAPAGTLLLASRAQPWRRSTSHCADQFNRCASLRNGCAALHIQCVELRSTNLISATNALNCTSNALNCAASRKRAHPLR